MKHPLCHRPVSRPSAALTDLPSITSPQPRQIGLALVVRRCGPGRVGCGSDRGGGVVDDDDNHDDGGGGGGGGVDVDAGGIIVGNGGSCCDGGGVRLCSFPSGAGGPHWLALVFDRPRVVGMADDEGRYGSYSSAGGVDRKAGGLNVSCARVPPAGDRLILSGAGIAWSLLLLLP